MTSRSGSSFTARIFAEHGLEHNGNENYENQRIKHWVKSRFIINHSNPKLLTPAESAIKEFKRLVEEEQINLWKGAVMFYPLFHQFKPKIVGIQRDMDAATRSIMNKNSGAKDYDKTYSIINKRYQLMDGIVDQYGGVIVQPDELVKGDYSSLEQAFDYCELEFDPAIARNVIDPSKWHFKNEHV